MRVKAEFLFWLIIICATGFLAGSQVASGATKTQPVVKVSSVSCTSKTVKGTLTFNQVKYRITRLVTCSDGRITVSGKRR